MNILDFINTGKDNAITREELTRATGISDRAIRRDINEAFKRGEIVINLGYGYFKPMPNKEDHLVKEYLNIEKARVKDENRKIRMMERYLEDV